MLDYLIFVGRFQYFHVGQKFVIDEALKNADKIIILIGSSFACSLVIVGFLSAINIPFCFLLSLFSIIWLMPRTHNS